MDSLESLDTEELFRLALLDVQTGRHDAAIIKLKQVVFREPKDARAHFMLAAEHAELGLYDRAEEGMRRAIDLDGSLHTARFQLGLLQYSRGDATSAADTWIELEKLGDRDPLNLFKSALVYIQGGSFAQAIQELESALEASDANPALKNDIAKVLTNVRGKLADEQAAPAATTETGGSAGAGLLRRYGDLDS
ncbi:lipopolysaccharide assembly protein LapB [Solimonas sp. SE-A11]|uniref:tetratricopeptide repeat protein n=1 Tax=Solimonas sp. SE-A11 TaxID=3054954 RepID=UPI00259C8784|nr:tetratricopeptide repeat protein [Solimonas sp. SE-A11]MDM4772926.1 tetratricopeptide repeat protein [Solimonas sp. SE-A11]